MTRPDTASPTINGYIAPKRIWLMDLGCGEITWCEDQNPDGEQADAIEYVRADIARQSQSPDTSLSDAMKRVEAVLDAALWEHGPPDQSSIWADVRVLTQAVKAKDEASPADYCGIVQMSEEDTRVAPADEIERLREIIERLGGGCDANHGGPHSAMKQGKDDFCPDCGSMLKRVAYEVLVDVCNSWDCPDTPFTPQMPRIYKAAKAVLDTK